MIRFRVALLVLMAGLVLLTVSAVGIFAYLTSRSASRELSQQVLEQTALRINEEIEQLLRQATTPCSLSIQLIESQRLGSRDYPKLLGYWEEVLSVYPELTSLFLGYKATGETLGLSRLRGKLSVWQTEQDPTTKMLQLREYWPADYPRKPFKSEPTKADVRTRPWYVLAAEKRRPIWTETYVFLGVQGSPKVPGVTYAAPFHHPDGTLEGVLSADFDLGTLSRFLGTLHIGEAGSAFLVELREGGDRRIIAHSQSEILSASRRSSNLPAEPLRVDDLEDGHALAFLQGLPAGVGAETVPATSSFRFTFEGEDYLGSFHSPGDESKPRWLICAYLPEEEVLAHANRINRLTLVIMVGVLGLAVVLSLVLSRQVAWPLEQMAREAIEVGHLRLEPHPPIRSVVLEVNRLGTAAAEMKAGLRSFQKYVPADLVRALLDSGQEAKLGGETRVVTILFSDIAGFTSLAESMPCEALVSHLGDYLAALSEEILALGGTVDKFIGDSIMAFWGAPALNERHAASACLAALRCQQRLRELRPAWQAQGKPLCLTRLGIHTGDAIVGNIGSPARMNYTLIGDAVNLASRLEGLNKHYGTDILFSEQTYLAAREAIVARPLDWVSVQGRIEPVLIYELLGLPAEATPATVRLAEAYGQALTLFRERQWQEALRLLDEVLRIRPDDGPARMLISRCKDYLESPPDDGWDGVHRMTSK
jgi:adenylate cyclase